MESAAGFFIAHISKYSNVLDINFIDQHSNKFFWNYLSNNKSLPLTEALIERYADKLEFSDFLSDENEVAEKLFSSWTKQEISIALERIKSAHYKYLS